MSLEELLSRRTFLASAAGSVAVLAGSSLSSCDDINVPPSPCPIQGGKLVVVDSFETPATGPIGLAWDGKYLWNSDDWEKKIFQLTTYGEVVHSISTFFEGEDYNPHPMGLAFDGTYLWCADRDKKKLYQLTLEGTIVDVIPSPSDLPIGVAWDGEYLLVADHPLNKVYKLTTAAEVVDEFSVPDPQAPSGLAGGAGSCLWGVAGGYSGDGKIRVYTDRLKEFLTFDAPAQNALNVTWSDEGYLWLLDHPGKGTEKGTIYKLKSE